MPHFEDTNASFVLGAFDLRITAPSYSGSGRTICNLVKDTTSKVIKTFLQTTYVSSYLTHEDEFKSRMKVSIANFEALAPTTFTQLLQLIQYTTQGNQLLTGSFTNAKLQYHTVLGPNLEKNNIERQNHEKINTRKFHILGVEGYEDECERFFFLEIFIF